MKAIAVLSKPGGKRRIPDSCLDRPSVLVQCAGGQFGVEVFDEGDLQGSLMGVLKTGAWDGTPHICAGDKLALYSMAAGKNYAFLWEGRTAREKRQIVHLETIAGAASRQFGGVPASPAVVWGTLAGEKFPGEGALVDDPALAQSHLQITLRLARASGFDGEDGELGATGRDGEGVGVGGTDAVEMPPPGIGYGYFSWIKGVLPGVLNEGPLGRGWGRVPDEKRESYFSEGGRMDPGAVFVRGFVYVTTEGQAVYLSDDEGDALRRGFEFLEIAKFSTNIVVEDTRSFKTFTLIRAAVCDRRLPSWILFPQGRGWVVDISRFCPPMETDPLKWILRAGVTAGMKTCSSLIAEPSLGFFEGDGGSPVIAAKSLLGAMSFSPYFLGGRDKAPELWRGSS